MSQLLCIFRKIFKIFCNVFIWICRRTLLLLILAVLLFHIFIDGVDHNQLNENNIKSLIHLHEILHEIYDKLFQFT